MGIHEVTLREFLVFYHDARYKTDAERDKLPSLGMENGKPIESASFANSADSLRCADRGYASAHSRNCFSGFRVVMDPQIRTTPYLRTPIETNYCRLRRSLDMRMKCG